jgi:hypothetical protein
MIQRVGRRRESTTKNVTESHKQEEEEEEARTTHRHGGCDHFLAPPSRTVLYWQACYLATVDCQVPHVTHPQNITFNRTHILI